MTMRVLHSSYQGYISSLNETLKDELLYSPVLLNNETILFPLTSDDHKALAISLSHGSPLVYLIEDSRFYSSFENTFFLKFKKLVQKSFLKNIELDNKDFIVRICLEVDDEIDSKKYEIIVELNGSKPNLILLDENDIVLGAYFKDRTRPLIIGEKYIQPKGLDSLEKGEPISKEIIQEHFQKELVNRDKEKYEVFYRYVNSKLRIAKRKINAINEDLKVANENLKYSMIADAILCLGIDLKSHLKNIEVEGSKVPLNESKTLLENVEHFYKRAKKAKETIARSDANIKVANEEISSLQALLDEFNNANEHKKDKMLSEYGNNKKKKETKETPFNKPYKVNFNGTIIYFGRNASQNDYLSFVMKLDREFTWLHIKDKSGAHLVICNKKPTEKELQLACELALVCSRCQSGEVSFTKKKNVRRGHTLGEALIKNYSTVKINSVSKETNDIFLKAERVK